MNRYQIFNWIIESISNNFSRQSEITKDLRNSIYNKYNLRNAKKVLDLGCGDGKITKELSTFCCMGEVIGLDLNINLLKRKDPSLKVICGDAEKLPFQDNTFDVVFTHLFFLWVSRPLTVIKEIVRVTRDGGLIIASAEPDYEGRIDYPAEFSYHKSIFLNIAPIWGLDTTIGRKLGSFFIKAGVNPQIGIYPLFFSSSTLAETFQKDWERNLPILKQIFLPDELENLKMKEKEAIQKGERWVYYPLFYVIAQK